jgi:alpha-D-ribose 1-methylphosphonate 5-triphosphate synthase subunit PhnI
MAYVAARGGEQAIQNAEKLYHLLKAPLDSESVRVIEQHLPYLLDRVMGEGSLYAPELAALALAQTGGDLYEATLLLRSYRSTQPRIAYAEAISQESVLTVRRISAAFKDIPGGQLLGPTLDYSHRILKLEALAQSAQAQQFQTQRLEPSSKATPATQPALADWQRQQGLLAKVSPQQEDVSELPDVTREPMLFPAPRAQRLQSLARAETGGLLSFAYTHMRGYGTVHPTVNEVRLGYADVMLEHPVTGVRFSAGRVRVSQGEVVIPFSEKTEPEKAEDAEPQLGIGFTATLGWNEVKVISGAMLDMAMSEGGEHPMNNDEFILEHTESVEASGFCIHYKLPHYVTFQSSLEAMRKVSQGKEVEKAKDEGVKG